MATMRVTPREQFNRGGTRMATLHVTPRQLTGNYSHRLGHFAACDNVPGFELQPGYPIFSQRWIQGPREGQTRRICGEHSFRKRRESGPKRLCATDHVAN